MGTEKNLTIDMLENIQNPEERFKVLAMYTKQLGDSIHNLKQNCPVLHGDLENSLQHLQYLIKGANGSGGGLTGHMERLMNKITVIEKKQEKIENQYTQFHTEFKITMAKAAVLMSLLVAVLIPTLGKVIDTLVP